ncbi:hypothetical protein GCM10020001_077430 [Nonomuraea salmonea]
MQAVEVGVRAPERAGRPQIGMTHDRLDRGLDPGPGTVATAGLDPGPGAVAGLGQRARPAVDLGVPEAVHGEAGLPLLGDVVAAQRVRVRGGGVAQWTEAERAVLQDLGVAEGDRLPGRTLDADAQPAGDVLAEVEDGLAGRACQHLPWPQRLDPAHRRTRRRDEPGGVVAEHVGGRPGGGFEAGLRPALGQQAGVVPLAVVQAGGGDRARGAAPVLVGDDQVGAAVLVGDLQLGDERDAVAVDGGLAAAEADAAAVPAVGQGGADRVGALAQQGGDVVGAVAQPPVVAAPAGGEHVVADGPAVQLGLVQAVGGDVQAGARDGAAQGEVAAQQQGGAVGRAEQAARWRGGPRLPVGGLQQAGLDRRPVAPAAGGAVGAVHADARLAPLARPERRARPGHEHRLPRLDPPGRRAGRVADLDLVRRLRPAGRVGGRGPGQSWAALADAERVAVVLEGRWCDV